MEMDIRLLKKTGKDNTWKSPEQRIELPQLMGNQATLQRNAQTSDVIQRERWKPTFLPNIMSEIVLMRHHIIPIGTLEKFYVTLKEHMEEEGFTDILLEINQTIIGGYESFMSTAGNKNDKFNPEDKKKKYESYLKEKVRIDKELEEAEKLAHTKEDDGKAKAESKEDDKDAESIAKMEYENAKTQFFKFYTEFFCWMPGNLTLGPARKDDPGDNFDIKSAQIHAAHASSLMEMCPEEYELLFMKMQAFISEPQIDLLQGPMGIMNLLRRLQYGGLVDGSMDKWGSDLPTPIPAPAKKRKPVTTYKDIMFKCDQSEKLLVNARERVRMKRLAERKADQEAIDRRSKWDYTNDIEEEEIIEQRKKQAAEKKETKEEDDL